MKFMTFFLGVWHRDKCCTQHAHNQQHTTGAAREKMNGAIDDDDNDDDEERRGRRSIRLTSSATSRDGVLTTLLVFRRWIREQQLEISVPTGFVETLRGFALEPDLLDLDLGNSFHLVKQDRRDSSRAIQIFEFTAGDPATRFENELGVRFIRASDNDSFAEKSFVLDTQTGQILEVDEDLMFESSESESEIEGHRMFESSESTSRCELPVIADARTVLIEHWVAPRKWLLEGRAVIVRSSDVPVLKNGVYYVKGTALCAHAMHRLEQGFTLLLVKGDLFRVEMPGQARPLLFAGMMWKEGEATQSRGGPAALLNTRAQRQSRPDELAFIIAEKASRINAPIFTGQNMEQESSTKPGLKFVGGMCNWELHDVSTYVSGPWRHYDSSELLSDAGPNASLPETIELDPDDSSVVSSE